jgi:hypothetical protein
MSFACWITTATDTHSEYVINFVFPLSTLVKQTHTMFHYTYILSWWIWSTIGCLKVQQTEQCSGMRNTRGPQWIGTSAILVPRLETEPYQNIFMNILLFLNCTQWPKSKYRIMLNVIFHHQNYAELGPKFFSKLWNNWLMKFLTGHNELTVPVHNRIHFICVPQFFHRPTSLV